MWKAASKEVKTPIHGCATRLRRLEHAIGLPHIIDQAMTLIDQHRLSAVVQRCAVRTNAPED